MSDRTDPCGWPEGTVHPHVEQCHRAERERAAAEVEAILTARLAARDAEWRAKVEALHRPYWVCDDCDHEHTDADVREGRAFDTGYSYTCRDAALYIACVTCCSSGQDDPEQSEDCVTYHEHTLDPAQRCATVRLLAEMGAAGEETP